VGVQVSIRGPVVRATVKTRESVTQLSPERLAAFRAAMTQFIARSDNRGYQFFAGWHGVPDQICKHHVPLFLPWHRGYLYHFELALQDIDPDVTLPWWNWMDESAIPDAYAAEQVDGSDNVLFSAPVLPMFPGRQDWWPAVTHREVWDSSRPGPGPVPPPLSPNLGWLMEPTSYDEFNQRCWRLHDNIHGWVGGEMGDPDWAAFDPLFWAHHTMVDRLWRIWQEDHQGADPSADLIDTAMTFGRTPSFTVREVLDVKRLGYEYAGQTASVSAEGAG
jgi:tyrosinase